MYRAAFYDLEAGRAAAAAVLLLALNIGLAVLAVAAHPPRRGRPA